jgi:hypothetical protein
LLVWVFLIAVVLFGTGMTVAGLPPTSPGDDESMSGDGSVSDNRHSTVATGPSVADVADVEAKSAGTDASRTSTGRTQPSYNCSKGEEQEDVTLPQVERETYFQTAVDLEMFNSTVTRRVPENGSKTFGILVGKTEADRLCTSLVEQDSAIQSSVNRPTRIRIQLKNPQLTNIEILGNGITIRFERGKADYINQHVSFGTAMQLAPETTTAVTSSDQLDEEDEESTRRANTSTAR